MPQGKSRAKPQAAARHREKPDALAKAVGQRVRRFRDEADHSFDSLVEETKLGRGYVSELARGLVVPTLTSLAKLAKALNVRVADLVVDETDAREQLFSLTRELEPAQVQELLALATRMAASARATKG